MSIGAGFRGGLFFASLFLGALLGKLFAACLAMLTVGTAVPAGGVRHRRHERARRGGGRRAADHGVPGAGEHRQPADDGGGGGGSVVSALTVRRTFGYSFATWRFHLRGEAIRSAVDIGWMRNLTVGRMMRRDVRTVRADTPLAAFRRDFPLGATTRVVVVDEAGRYAGIVLLAEAHAADCRRRDAGRAAAPPGDVLLPQMTIKDAVEMFENGGIGRAGGGGRRETRRVIGLLTEQHALRRYSEELDRAGANVGRVIPTGGGAVPWRDVRPSPEIAGRSVRGLASGAARGAPRLRRAGTPLR